MSFAQELRNISQEALKKSREEIVQGALTETLTQEEKLFMESYARADAIFTGCKLALTSVAKAGINVCFAVLRNKDEEDFIEFNRNHQVFVSDCETDAEKETVFKALRIRVRKELGVSVERQPHIDKWRFSWEK